MNFKIFTILFLLLGFTPTLNSFAQSCDCDNTISYAEAMKKKDPQQIISTLKNSKSQACKAKGFEFAAQNCLNKNEIDSIDFYLKIQKQILKKQGCPIDHYYNHYYIYSNYYYLKEDIQNMVKATYKTLEIAESTKKDDEIFYILANLCLGYKLLKQPKLIEKYAKRMYSIAKKNQNSKERMEQMASSSVQYLVLYQDLGQEAYLDTSRIQITQALDLAKRFKDTTVMISSYRRIEAFYFYKKNFELALENEFEALKLARNYTDFQEGISNIYGDIADIYIEKKDFSTAKIYADSSIQSALQSKSSYLILNAYGIGIKTFERTRDFEKAFFYLKEVKAYEDSLLSAEKHKTIYELEQKYQKAQDIKKISDLAKTKKINDLRFKFLLAFIAVICLILVVLIFLFRQNRIKSRFKQLETEQRLNRARMEPHFFFNALSSIQTLALTEQSPKTVLLLSKFSKIMRQSLESTYQELVSIEDEISFLQHYIDLQKMRHPDKFEYYIEAGQDLEINELLVPSMLLQPFVENAIEHGFKNIKDGGELRIKYQQNQNKLIISVIDNGTSAEAQSKSDTSHVSRAIQIINDRLFLLKKQTGKEASFEIIDSSSSKGYEVKLTLPLLYQK